MSDDAPKVSRLEAIEQKREARKAALACQRDDQRATDLEAIDALETELGDSNVAFLEAGFIPGLPVLAAVRTPKGPEIKRYQDRCRGKGERDGNATQAAAELGAVCRVYPADVEWSAMLEARPALVVGLGVLAAGLATGRANELGKD